MAAQNGKTGVPTGSLSDNHIFLVRSQTNLYIIEYKQVCTRRSIAPVYEGTFIKYYKISQLIHTQSIAN